MKNISAMYKDMNITSNGEIVQGNRRFNLYEITPVNIIEKNENIKQKIYNLYYSCVKGMPNEFKILVAKEKLDISQNISLLQKRAAKVSSPRLKAAITLYADNLKEVLSQSVATLNKYYIVAHSTENVEERFHSLEEVGVGIRKVTSEYEVQKIFRKEVLQQVL